MMDDTYEYYLNKYGYGHHEVDNTYFSISNVKIHFSVNGNLHRENGPAVIWNDGEHEWFNHGEYHRLDGPAVINGVYRAWFINGKLHRLDGPAIIDVDRQEWFIDGELHRIDGPAVITGDYQAWYIHGYIVTDKIHEWAKINNIDLDNLTDDDKVLIKLVWSDYNG